MVVEALKHRFNRGRRSNLSFFRAGSGLECDLLLENGSRMAAIETKSGSTVASDWFDSLNRVAKALPPGQSSTEPRTGSHAKTERSFP